MTGSDKYTCYNVSKFQKAIRSSHVESDPYVGLGVDFRLESKKVTGFTSAFDDQVLHVSIFKKANEKKRKQSEISRDTFCRRTKKRA